MAQSTVRFPLPESAGGLARRTAAGVLVATVALLVAQAIVDTLDTDVGVTGPTSPFAAGPLVGATIAAWVSAAVTYAALVRVTASPARNFVGLAIGVFVVMLGPVVGAPPEGITTTGQAILVLYHALVAVPLVALVLGIDLSPVAIGQAREKAQSGRVAQFST